MSVEPTRPLRRDDKEALLGQRGLVVWIYGLSGAGKTTLSHALERSLHAAGKLTVLIDGDIIRSGLSQDLGFSVADREENIRRVAEVARLLVSSGVVVICALITPTKAMRALARKIIGADDFMEVYLRCSFSECQRRDVKGLYAQADDGQLKQFTGLDSVFEEPDPAANECLVIHTETQAQSDSMAQLYEKVSARLAGARA
jgi:adenylylsulfate kinase